MYIHKIFDCLINGDTFFLQHLISEICNIKLEVNSKVKFKTREKFHIH